MSRLAGAAAGGMVLVGLAAWLAAAQEAAPSSAASTEPRPVAVIVVPDAARLDALARAAVRLESRVEPRLYHPAPHVECLFQHETPSGTTPKFRCALPDGEVVKVKYGRTPEIPAEVAASRLLAMLGYAADTVTIVPRVRCYGCPRYPFMASRLFEAPLFRRILSQPGAGEYTDFAMVAVERMFPAPAIESDSATGWAWWELEHSAASRADLDALRLLAMFLAHWDNKADNQRLVCLDAPGHEEAPGICRDPLLMIQDLGATFGPYKANLGGWRGAPLWSDAAECRISMAAFPFHGASFPDARISEEGRLQLLAQLQALTDSEIRGLFREARFPEYQGTTDDGRDLDVWTSAFNRRVRLLAAAGPCPPA